MTREPESTIDPALLEGAAAHGDPVELSSIHSFPASDPPSWIAREPAEKKVR
jgi:hypothetical protein